MTDEDAPETPEEVVEWLDQRSGQSYFRADTAWEVVCAIGKSVTAEYVREYDPHADEDTDLTATHATQALSTDLKQRQRPAADARGMLTVYPHQMVVTASDISAQIVEAIGKETSSYSAAGSGFTADGRHRENVETIRHVLLDD